MSVVNALLTFWWRSISLRRCNRLGNDKKAGAMEIVPPTNTFGAIAPVFWRSGQRSPTLLACISSSAQLRRCISGCVVRMNPFPSPQVEATHPTLCPMRPYVFRQVIRTQRFISHRNPLGRRYLFPSCCNSGSQIASFTDINVARQNCKWRNNLQSTIHCLKIPTTPYQYDNLVLLIHPVR